MAKRRRHVDSADIEGLLECGICLEEFKDPRSLPCVHSFCLECLTDHVSQTKRRDGTFRCPQCRTECTAPGGDVKNFPKNFFVNQLRDILPVSVAQQLSSVRTEDYGAPNCDRHIQPVINRYCRTCTLPVCSECVREGHQGHDTEELDVVAENFKLDLVDVSKMGAKRITTLKKMSADLDATKLKMEESFDQADRDITVAAEGMHSLVSNHEQMLRNKLKRTREAARKHIDTAKEELNIALENTSSLMSSTESSSERDVALCTAIGAPSIKKQFLGQEQLSVPSADCKIIKHDVSPRELIATPNYVGDIETSTFSERRAYVKTETGNLGIPLKTIKIDYTGQRAVGGIAPIHNTMICVAYFGGDNIRVYSNTGQLTRKLTIPGIEKVYGLVTVNKMEGKVAIVDGGKKEVHLVTLSERLQVVQQTTMAVPITPGRISIGQNKHLVVNHWRQKRIVTLQPDGQLVSDIRVPIPQDRIVINCVAQTTSGFVINDPENEQVYFTDVEGHILHTSTDCVGPWRAVQTSWGHVLIADYDGDEIKAFSEHGDFLGNVHDSQGSVADPQYIHIDEAEGLLYVACGFIGRDELRIYKFAPSDLPPLPVQRCVKELTVDIKLAKP